MLANQRQFSNTLNRLFGCAVFANAAENCKDYKKIHSDYYTYILTIRILMGILPFTVQYWHKRMNLYLYCWMLELIQPFSTSDSSLPFMKLQELDFFRK